MILACSRFVERFRDILRPKNGGRYRFFILRMLDLRNARIINEKREEQKKEEERKRKDPKKRKKNRNSSNGAQDAGGSDSDETSSDESSFEPRYVPKRKEYRNAEFYRKRNAYSENKKRAHAAGIKPEVPDSYLTGRFTKIDVAKFKKNWGQISKLPMVIESREHGSRYKEKKRLRQEFIKLAIRNKLLR